MTTRRRTPICGAARPAPLRCAMVSRMSWSSSASSGVSNFSTGSDFCQSSGSPMRSTSRITAGSSFLLAEFFEDAPNAAHGHVEHFADLVERHGAGAVAAAGGVIRDHRDRRVVEAYLARERGLGHAGHPDDVRAVALEARDLGGALEARPLGGGVD